MSIRMPVRRMRRSQPGFTLAETMIAIIISALIVVGSLMLMGHLVTVSVNARNDTLAILNLQYVGFWVSEDAIQAQAIGNLTDPRDPKGVGMGNVTETGFPLAIQWTEWDGDINHVTYTMGNMTDDLDRRLWRLERTHWLKPHNKNWEDHGMVIVAEYLCPETTRCYWDDPSDKDLLTLEVTTKVDLNEASNTYKISPRAFAN